MRCENCHRKIKNEAEICPYCGRIVHKEQETVDSKTKGPMYDRFNLSKLDQRKQKQETKLSMKSSNRRKRKQKTIVLFAGILVTIMMFVGGIYFVVMTVGKGNKEELIFDENNYGSYESDWVYYNFDQLKGLGSDIIQVRNQEGRVYINLDQIFTVEEVRMEDESQQVKYGVKLTLKDDYAKLLTSLLASAKIQDESYEIICCKETINTNIGEDQLEGNTLIIKGITDEERANEMVIMLNLALLESQR